jgi:hypothetical protein
MVLAEWGMFSEISLKIYSVGEWGGAEPIPEHPAKARILK